MPVENYSIYGCSASRRYTGVTFFKALNKTVVLQKNGPQN